MIWQEVLAVGASIIASLGGAGIIIFALSGWLGKVWAERVMETERAAHAARLEELRAELYQKNQAEIESIKADLTSNNHRKLTSFHERLAIYKVVVDMFAEFLFDIQAHFISDRQIPISHEKIIEFEKLRMRTFGYLALLASQDVINAHEKLVELILNVLEGGADFSWADIRNGCMNLINSSRKDLGLDNNVIIQYEGNR